MTDTVAEMRSRLVATWPVVAATYDRSVDFGGDRYRIAFDGFEMLKATLEAADTEPCPVSWCDRAGSHGWSYQLHHPAPDLVDRVNRGHRHQVSDAVTVELVEFDGGCYSIPGFVEPGDDDPVIAVDALDLCSLDEVEAHIAALREAARIAFGEQTR